jgi:hypothetical protein
MAMRISASERKKFIGYLVDIVGNGIERGYKKRA